ncbi:HTTM domain-containing protein [Inquilinus sp. CAU 1745]|uniref:HTTM domain-containing protein n=1 Tax=Inquilinus sp. CAU 1745 TaxID=3140369 RepID=UPI00325A805E
MTMPASPPSDGHRPAWRRCADRLFDPVSVASLVVFRILFGTIMVWEVLRYANRGWIEAFYLDPEFLFTYYGFEWLAPLGGVGLHWLFYGLGVLAAMIAVGAFYRIATILFFLGFTYVFLLDQARYLNHFYLVSLVAFLMCFIPAHRAWSVDAVLRKGFWSDTVPRWSIWLLIVQFEIMYIFAGLVKINGDWLRLEPMSMWLGNRTDFLFIGPLFAYQPVVAIAAYGVILLHVVGAPLLLWKRTRPWVFSLYVAFHFANHLLFQIGIFPWLAIAGTLMFFEPDWPRRFARLARDRLAAAGAAIGDIADRARKAAPPYRATPSLILRTVVIAGVACWTLFQILMPMRHHLYPGDTSWHEQGHRFAWQMKLRQKSATTVFMVADPATGDVWKIDPLDYLSDRQDRYMAGRPDMILQFAHHLEDVWAEEYGIEDVEVRALSFASLNGREPQLLVDPSRDLTEIERSLAPADWIMPLTEPLRRPESQVADGG